MDSFLRLRYLRVLLFVLLFAPAACVSGGGGGGGGSGNGLTAEDLSGVTATSLLDAIRSLRPAWLRLRGGTAEPIEVYVDGVQRMDRVDALARISVQDVLEVRRLSASDATTRFGTGHQSGAILVRTR